MKFYHTLQLWIGGLLLSFSWGAFADEYSEKFAPYPGSGGVQLGTGWDSFRGEKSPGSCVIAGRVTDQGQIRNVPQYKEITDTSSLMSAFSVSAEAKIGAKERAQALHSAKVSKSTIMVLI
jgi:hypothetical protein